jgi:hypothetical protein
MNDPHRIPSTPEDIIELYRLCIQYHGKDKKECQIIEKLYNESLKDVPPPKQTAFKSPWYNVFHTNTEREGGRTPS